VLQLHNTGRQQTESGDHLSTKLKEKTKQNKTKQNKTKQNKTKQNKTNKQTKNIQQEEAGVVVVCRMFVQVLVVYAMSMCTHLNTVNMWLDKAA